MIVPPVPTPATKMSTLPSVSAQISGPVVALWTAGLAVLGLGDGALHALCAFGEHQLGAVGLHKLAALDAHRLGHDDDDAIAPRRRDGGKTDAGVAGGGLDDDGIGLEQSPALGIVDHRLGNAVLDRAGGVEIFKLGKQTCLQLLFLFDMRQLQQRGLSDQLIGRCKNGRHDKSSLYLDCCWFVFVFLAATSSFRKDHIGRLAFLLY